MVAIDILKQKCFLYGIFFTLHELNIHLASNTCTKKEHFIQVQIQSSIVAVINFYVLTICTKVSEGLTQAATFVTVNWKRISDHLSPCSTDGYICGEVVQELKQKVHPLIKCIPIAQKIFKSYSMLLSLS